MQLYNLTHFKWQRNGWYEAGHTCDRFFAVELLTPHEAKMRNVPYWCPWDIHGRVLNFIIAKGTILGYCVPKGKRRSFRRNRDFELHALDTTRLSIDRGTI